MKRSEIRAFPTLISYLIRAEVELKGFMLRQKEIAVSISFPVRAEVELPSSKPFILHILTSPTTRTPRASAVLPISLALAMP